MSSSASPGSSRSATCPSHKNDCPPTTTTRHSVCQHPRGPPPGTTTSLSGATSMNADHESLRRRKNIITRPHGACTNTRGSLHAGSSAAGGARQASTCSQSVFSMPTSAVLLQSSCIQDRVSHQLLAQQHGMPNKSRCSSSVATRITSNNFGPPHHHAGAPPTLGGPRSSLTEAISDWVSRALLTGPRPQMQISGASCTLAPPPPPYNVEMTGGGGNSSLLDFLRSPLLSEKSSHLWPAGAAGGPPAHLDSATCAGGGARGSRGGRTSCGDHFHISRLPTPAWKRVASDCASSLDGNNRTSTTVGHHLDEQHGGAAELVLVDNDAGPDMMSQQLYHVLPEDAGNIRDGGHHEVGDIETGVPTSASSLRHLLDASETTYMMVNTIVGSILLSMPYAFLLSGGLAGFVLLTLTTFLLCYTGRVMGKLLVLLEDRALAENVPVERQDLGWLAYAAFGARGRSMVEAIFCCELFMGTLSFLILGSINSDILSEFFVTVVSSVLGLSQEPSEIPTQSSSTSNDAQKDQVSVIAIVGFGAIATLTQVAVVVFPTAAMRVLAGASKVSVYALFVCLVGLLVSGLWGQIQAFLYNNGVAASSISINTSTPSTTSGIITAPTTSAHEDDDLSGSSTSYLSSLSHWVDMQTLPLGLGTILFAYAGHPCFPQIFHAMANPKQDFGPSCNKAFAFAWILYGVVGLGGFILYNQYLQPSFVQNIGHAADAASSPLEPEWLFTALRVFATLLMTIKILGVYPLVAEPVISTFLTVVVAPMMRRESENKSKQTEVGGGETEIQEEEKKEDTSDMTGKVASREQDHSSIVSSPSSSEGLEGVAVGSTPTVADFDLGEQRAQEEAEASVDSFEEEEEGQHWSTIELIVTRALFGVLSTALAYLARNQLPSLSAVAGGVLTMASSVLTPCLSQYVLCHATLTTSERLATIGCVFFAVCGAASTVWAALFVWSRSES